MKYIANSRVTVSGKVFFPSQVITERDGKIPELVKSGMVIAVDDGVADEFDVDTEIGESNPENSEETDAADRTGKADNAAANVPKNNSGRNAAVRKGRNGR